jgi:hypothetical protein
MHAKVGPCSMYGMMIVLSLKLARELPKYSYCASHELLTLMVRFTLVVSLTLAIDYGDSAQTGSSYLEP